MLKTPTSGIKIQRNENINLTASSNTGHTVILACPHKLNEKSPFFMYFASSTISQSTHQKLMAKQPFVMSQGVKTPGVDSFLWDPSRPGPTPNKQNVPQGVSSAESSSLFCLAVARGNRCTNSWGQVETQAVTGATRERLAKT